MLQGRSAWQSIEFEDKKLEMEEQKRLDNSKQRKDMKLRDHRRGEMKTRMAQYHFEKRKYDSKSEDVKKLQDILRIGREDEIIDTYRELMGNREKIKEITMNYKKRVDEVEEEIRELQEEYKRQKFENPGIESRYDDPSHIEKMIKIIKTHEKEFGVNSSMDDSPYTDELIKLRKN